ncbi:hypothetical protein [Bifidobacterium stellenboschense]|uniref:hypothetical protein n=1 Tax=Bifidobacterium stellenboschense TaxID=762211 RepID=UPI0012EB0D30|nr:hypothetical protein [Bifidobacterium stellenboschense]
MTIETEKAFAGAAGKPLIPRPYCRPNPFDSFDFFDNATRKAAAPDNGNDGLLTCSHQRGTTAH